MQKPILTNPFTAKLQQLLAVLLQDKAVAAAKDWTGAESRILERAKNSLQGCKVGKERPRVAKFEKSSAKLQKKR